jgi:hypothetical protein
MFKQHFNTFLVRVVEWTCAVQAIAWLAGVFDELTTLVKDHTSVAVAFVAGNAIYSLWCYDVDRNKLQDAYEKRRKMRRRRRG